MHKNKALYPSGTFIKLLFFANAENDPHPVKAGTYGHVDYVDDAGQLHVIWEDGRCLAIHPDYGDAFEIID